VGADSKRPLAALLGVLLIGCGGGGGAEDDDDGSEMGTTSSASNTGTVGATGTAASTSGGGATSSGSGATAAGSVTTGSSTTGDAAPWVCLEVSSGCLCSTIPGSEGETEPCATAYDCCYGLEGSTCYCLETPEAMCDQIIDVGYQRYDSCPPS